MAVSRPRSDTSRTPKMARPSIIASAARAGPGRSPRAAAHRGRDFARIAPAICPNRAARSPRRSRCRRDAAPSRRAARHKAGCASPRGAQTSWCPGTRSRSAAGGVFERSIDPARCRRRSRKSLRAGRAGRPGSAPRWSSRSRRGRKSHRHHHHGSASEEAAVPSAAKGKTQNWIWQSAKLRM
jgi:hypothetical protein